MTPEMNVAPFPFVHGKLHQQLGLSAFGCLLHLVRANYFGRRDLLAAFGTRLRHQHEDLSQVLMFSLKHRDVLAKTCQVPAETVHGWDAAPWLPFRFASPWERQPWQLRACEACLRYGYHSNLFQMPWLARCPWHRTPLVTACSRCDLPLREGLLRGNPLLKCPCGHDPVDVMHVLRGDPQAADRDACVKEYLAWAQQRRTHQQIVPPEDFNMDGMQMFPALVRSKGLAPHWREVFAQPDRAIHLNRVGPESMPASRAPAPGVIGRWAGSVWPSSDVADVPAHLSGALRHLTRRIAEHIPSNLLTDSERQALALGKAAGPSVVPTSRKDLLFLPMRQAHGSGYLDVRIMHRAAYRMVGLLGWRLQDLHPGKSTAVGTWERILVEAMGRILGRAYGDGLRHGIARHVPAVYDDRRQRPGIRLPWVLLDRDAPECRIAWSPRKRWPEPPWSSAA